MKKDSQYLHTNRERTEEIILEEYILNHSSEEPELLEELNRETHLEVLRPRMLSGHLQGRILSMLTKMLKPKRILEVGTYTAYATLCMAEGLAEDGVIHTIELNDELETRIEKWISKAGMEERIKLHIGDALQIIDNLDEDFDLVFLDADKSNYPRYFEKLVKKLKPGAFIIADNVLWDGKVTMDVAPNDKDTIGILEFNKMVKEHPSTEEVILPVRDGLNLIHII